MPSLPNLLLLGAALSAGAAGTALAPLATGTPASPPASVALVTTSTHMEKVPGSYLPSVEAPVVDDFRPPQHFAGPGNRGLEYDTQVGQQVRASADGEVVFAGPVAGNLFVTVLHGDNLRTTYGYLQSMDVATGDRLVAGQPLGSTSSRYFFSVRAGQAYLDPAVLLEAPARNARLVPLQGTDPGITSVRDLFVEPQARPLADTGSDGGYAFRAGGG